MLVASWLSAAQTRLATSAAAETPGFDAAYEARALLRAVYPEALYQNKILSTDEQAQLDDFLARRCLAEPLSRILGQRGFWKIDLNINAATLDPRPDSEALIELALKAFPTPPSHILDLGTGSGCLLLALLHEWPSAKGLGIDISADAINMARHNALRLGLADRADFRVGDFHQSLPQPKSATELGAFDLIISNPPYIASAEIGTLSAAVRFYDPLLALDGGPDGLNAYRAILEQAKNARTQQKNAAHNILFEVGVGQAEQVATLARQYGYKTQQIQRDLSGIERILWLCLEQK